MHKGHYQTEQKVSIAEEVAGFCRICQVPQRFRRGGLFQKIKSNQKDAREMIKFLRALEEASK
jgi:hypothetical protein